MPSPISEMIPTAEIDKKDEVSLDIELVRGGGNADEKLADMIINAIVAGLKQSNQYLEEASKHNKKIQTDKNKINRITMDNGIDMNYGGGLLVFGPNFKIEQMIHMFYDKKKPVFFSTPVQDSMADDVVNTNIRQPTSYNSTTITEEIKKVISL